LPEQTIKDLNKNDELIMAFYFQLANMQIFPEDRLKVVLDYWEFSKKVGLEKISYSVTKNIIESFTPSEENREYIMSIVFAHISNNNFEAASKWLNIFDSSGENKTQYEYAKFLIDLYQNDDLNKIINFLNTVNNNTVQNSTNSNLEILDVLNRFLKIEKNLFSNYDYEISLEDRNMPQYFLIRDIKKNIADQSNLTLLLLSIISMNDKKWHELHPEHLSLMLDVYNTYDQGSLIKPIILEILNDLNII